MSVLCACYYYYYYYYCYFILKAHQHNACRQKILKWSQCDHSDVYSAVKALWKETAFPHCTYSQQPAVRPPRLPEPMPACQRCLSSALVCYFLGQCNMEMNIKGYNLNLNIVFKVRKFFLLLTSLVGFVVDFRGRSCWYRRKRKATQHSRPVELKMHITSIQRHWPSTQTTSSPTPNCISTVLLCAQR